MEGHPLPGLQRRLLVLASLGRILSNVFDSEQGVRDAYTALEKHGLLIAEWLPGASVPVQVWLTAQGRAVLRGNATGLAS